MSKWHKNLTQERWNRYPLKQQMLMIGSEFSRILHFNDEPSQKRCVERALELLDLASSDPQYASHKEIIRLRELLAKQYSKGIDLEKIEHFYRYCLEFSKL